MLRNLIVASLVLTVSGIQILAGEDAKDKLDRGDKFIRVSASDRGESVAVSWKMSLEDSLFLARAAMEIGDQKFCDKIKHDLAEQVKKIHPDEVHQLLSAQKTKRKLPPGLRIVEKPKASFRLQKHLFNSNWNNCDGETIS